MEFPNPQKGQFTIYSKSGCINCNKVKNLLKENNISFSVVDCDDFIFENKEEFLSFIKLTAGQEYRMFPIVFDNGQFIGGFNETIKYITNLQEKNLDFNSSF